MECFFDIFLLLIKGGYLRDKSRYWSVEHMQIVLTSACIATFPIALPEVEILTKSQGVEKSEIEPDILNCCIKGNFERAKKSIAPSLSLMPASGKMQV